MRSSVFGAVAFLASSGLALPEQLAERAACTTNACLAALATRTATAKPDCSSFVVSTVTPCPKFVTTTLTTTSFYGCPAQVITTSAIIPTSYDCPATQSPTAVPSYAASACSNGAAFSSACGCLNVRASRTTAAQATVTVTAYKTFKTKPKFVIKAIEGVETGQFLSGGYPDYLPNAPHDGGALYLQADNSTAEYYSIDGNGTVYGGNGTLRWISNAPDCYGCYTQVFEYPSDGSAYQAQNTVNCRLGTVLRGDGYLTFECRAPAGGARFLACTPDGGTASFDLGGTPDGERQCTVQKMGAYPICDPYLYL